jgi:hypothetical protein
MADTGAPWNIPYAEPSDLVRDWPALSEDVAEAVADALDDVVTAGIGSNVVQTVKTDTFSTTSTSYVALTGLSVSITPSSASSKILIFASVVNSSSNTTSNSGANFRFMRGATVIGVGDAAGSRTQASFGGHTRQTGDTSQVVTSTGVLVDSPNTPSAVTYSLEVRANAGTAYINTASGDDTDSATRGRYISTITVIEVAA